MSGLDLFEADVETPRTRTAVQEDLSRLDGEDDLPDDLVARLNKLCPLDSKHDDGPFDPIRFLRIRSDVVQILLAENTDEDMDLHEEPYNQED